MIAEKLKFCLSFTMILLNMGERHHSWHLTMTTCCKLDGWLEANVTMQLI